MMIRAGAPVTVCMAIFVSYLSVADLAVDDGGTCRDDPWRSVRERALRCPGPPGHQLTGGAGS